MKTIELKALIENYSALSDWFNKITASWNLSDGLINKTNVCLEEIFVNIASYAYKGKEGVVEVSTDKKDGEIILIFKDKGVAYNPLEREDPDITLSLEDRPIGGLGIFIVKELAKKVEYKRTDNENILKITFSEG